jgi:hypothetical protein
MKIYWNLVSSDKYFLAIELWAEFRKWERELAKELEYFWNVDLVQIGLSSHAQQIPQSAKVKGTQV